MSDACLGIPDRVPFSTSPFPPPVSAAWRRMELPLASPESNMVPSTEMVTPQSSRSPTDGSADPLVSVGVSSSVGSYAAIRGPTKNADMIVTRSMLRDFP